MQINAVLIHLRFTWIKVVYMIFKKVCTMDRIMQAHQLRQQRIRNIKLTQNNYGWKRDEIIDEKLLLGMCIGRRMTKGFLCGCAPFLGTIECRSWNLWVKDTHA
jgi:hypothetical protein